MGVVPLTNWLARLGICVFLWVGVQTLYSAPAYAWRGLFGEVTVAGAAVSVAFALAGTVLALRHRARMLALTAGACDALARIPPRLWWLAVLGGGLALRLAWLAVYPPAPQVSDHAIYLQLGRQLADGGAFFVGRTQAYWPPGYPMFIAPLLTFLDDGAGVVLGNVLLFVAAAWVVHRLGLALGGEALARGAVLLLALWPNHIAFISLAKKEALQLTLFALALLAYLESLRAGTSRERVLWSVLAGAAVGGASLTQPSTMLAPSIFIAYELLTRRGRGALARVACLVLGMALVIAPWTLRNQAVLNTFVPISTNGGHGFYSANYPGASGAYVAGFEDDFRGLDELETSRAGYAKGMAWIRENPGDFARLIWVKQVLLLGDDSDAIAWVMDLMHGPGGKPYYALKLLATAFWAALVVLACLQLLPTVRGQDPPPAEAFLLVLTMLYVYSIDSVAQSGSRHHIGVMIPIILLALGARRLRGPGEVHA